MTRTTAPERRNFPRVGMRCDGSLVTTHKKWPVHVIDVSFNGTLVALIHKHHADIGEGVVLTLDTGKGETIKMQGRIAHQKAHFIGIDCRATNIDHQARLRKLVDRPDTPRHMGRSLKTILIENDAE